MTVAKQTGPARPVQPAQRAGEKRGDGSKLLAKLPRAPHVVTVAAVATSSRKGSVDRSSRPDKMERLVNVMETETIPPERRRFYADMPEYHGVIAQSGSDRLVLSSKGTWYMHQRPVEGPEAPQELRFFTVRKVKLLSRIADKLPAALFEALPEGLADDPRECPRPWSEDLEAAQQSWRSAHPGADEYAGVIRRTDRGRLVVLWTKSGALVYGVQVPDVCQWSGGVSWTTVCQSRYAAVIRSGLNGERGKRCAPVVGDLLLWLEADKLQADAADFRGAKPPRKDELRQRFARPQPDASRSGARERTESGDKRPAKRAQDGAKVRQGGKAGKTA